MKPIEERLSQALHARAEQVRPEDLPTLPVPEPRRSRGLSARMMPLMAVAAVVLAVGLVATLPRLVGGQDPMLAPAESGDGATCWDGAAVEDLDECSLPDGVAGLQWVFPSFDPDDPGCTDAKETREDISRPAMWICTVTGPSGAEVSVRYSQIRRVQSGLTHYIDKFRGADQEIVSGPTGVERYVWRTVQPEEDGLYKLSSMYVGHPYSASVDAVEVTDREQVFDEVLRFRPAAEVRGLDH